MPALAQKGRHSTFLFQIRLLSAAEREVFDVEPVCSPTFSFGIGLATSSTQ